MPWVEWTFSKDLKWVSKCQLYEWIKVLNTCNKFKDFYYQGLRVVSLSFTYMKTVI